MPRSGTCSGVVFVVQLHPTEASAKHVTVITNKFQGVFTSALTSSPNNAHGLYTYSAGPINFMPQTSEMQN